MTMRSTSSVLVAAFVAIAAGCSSGVSLGSVTISPATASIGVGKTQALTVTATFSDGSKAAVDTGIAWSSSDTATASVASSGVVTGVKVGTATITAAYSGKSATAAVTVTAPALASIAAAPTTVSLAGGLTKAIVVTGTYDDGSTATLTSSATFSSSAAAYATVSAAGLITAVAPGTATITVTVSGKTATVAVTVTPAALVSIAAAPSSVTLEITKTQALTVTGTYTDGTTPVLTTGVTFSSAPASVATVDPSGLITGVAAGSATVTATSGTSTSTVSVTVNPKTLLSISATPSPLSLPIGLSQTLTVKGLYSNGDNPVLTTGVTFAVTASSPSGSATVGSTSGTVTGVAAGTATVTVSAGGKTTTVNVTVTAATVSSIAIDNTSPVALFVGGQATLTVTGTYSDASTHPFTTGVAFAVTAASPSGAATVGASSGVVAAVAAGTATVTATHTASGKTATVNVNIAAVTLTSITVVPNPITLPKTTGTVTLALTGHYNDGSSGALANASASFSSDASSVAAVSAAGVVTAGVAGTANITVGSASATTVVPATVYDPTSAFVFYGDYDPGVIPLTGFDGSDTVANPVTRDTTVQNNSRASLKIAAGTACAGYIGGYIKSSAPRDLHATNALSFWAKTDTAGASIHNIGFGNDNTSTGTNAFTVESHGPTGSGYAFTTTFTKYYIPSPNPAALTANDGLFYFSGGCPAAGTSFNVWLNDIQFETLSAAQLTSTFGAVSSASTGAPASLSVVVGTPALIGNPAPNTLIYANISVYQVGWANFTYASADATVVTVDGNANVIGKKAGGPVNLTLTFPGTSLSAAIAITVTAPLATPSTIATAPTLAAANVISLFSSTYTNVPIDTWRTSWSTCCNELVDPYAIGSHNVKKYTLHSFVGVEFVATPIDATAQTTFHVDVWSPNPPGRLEIQLVNDPGGPASVIAKYEATSIPTASWIGLEIPISAFSPALTPRNVLKQLLFVAQDAGGGNVNSVIYVDNIYFHK